MTVIALTDKSGSLELPSSLLTVSEALGVVRFTT